MKICFLTGGAPHYDMGLLEHLAQNCGHVDVIAGRESIAVATIPGVNFLQYRASYSAQESIFIKGLHAISYYIKVVFRLTQERFDVLHVQWPYKFWPVDRIFIPLLCLAIRTPVVLTAHNIDAAERDGKQSILNRLSLLMWYHLVNRIIVHTSKMEAELQSVFRIKKEKIAIIPHGIMSSVPQRGIPKMVARRKLQIPENARVLLFFGLITPYKGIETLIAALPMLLEHHPNTILLIAGRVKECPDYWAEINSRIAAARLEQNVFCDLRHIPDEEIEVYFAASDVLILPYRKIFQTGVLFLAFHFGLPVVATNVGSLADDLQVGLDGLIAKPDDPDDLARAISQYFSSEMFIRRSDSADDIKRRAGLKYSWVNIAGLTRQIYAKMCRGESCISV